MTNRFVSRGLVPACLVALASLAAPAADLGLPQGIFSGQGVWDALDGSEGTYETRYTIEDSRLAMDYTYEREGQEEAGHHELVVAPRAGGRFDLLDEEGNVAGQGFCRADTCLVKYTFPGGSVEQSMRLDGDKLVTVGTKSIGGFAVHWVETLDRR